MLRQRILAALILIPLVVSAILLGPSWFLAGVLLFLVVACAFEWAKLIPITALHFQLIYILLTIFAIRIGSLDVDRWCELSFLIWGLVFVAILTYPQSVQYWGYRIVVALVGMVLLITFANAFVGLFQFQNGRALMLYVLCLVWAADTGAYFAGKAWGRHALIPLVSPGKTIEGCLGGVVAVSAVAYIGSLVFKPAQASSWYLLAIATLIISIIGDLLISLLKRRIKIKDSGHLIPGHGGILDRLDSSIAAIPFFYFVLSSLERMY